MIRVSNLSKTYLVWRTPFSRLFVPLLIRILRPLFPDYCGALLQRACQSIRALEHLDFCVQEGDSLGIIGLNGSGKSTLLQIIAGTLQPTTGTVEVKGRIAALLELGSGFDPEFTGRENIYINASILGLNRREIDARYDAIVAFADIGDFIDRPVKTYSSGMMVRLAFAVQVHVEPDVLIVDEALSVGDARFQAKALSKIEEILKCGTTLLFVGHDLSAVRAFCNQAMLLDKGRIIKAGIPDDVIADYLYIVQKDRIAELGVGLDLKRKGKGFTLQDFDIVEARFTGMQQHATLAFGTELILDIDIKMATIVIAPFLIIDVIDSRGMQLTGKRIAVPHFEGVRKVIVNMRCSFQKGVYRVRLRLVSAPSLEQTLLMSRYDDLLSIEMIDDVRDQFTGLFPIPMDITWGVSAETGKAIN
ncbi:MAG: polysaccharide ABC transporter ATP-binding protein [Pseudomonadota bacterium]|nr:polysaccharide ABC transporter ATP-binding protein [Pseudomonadota bacterium]